MLAYIVQLNISNINLSYIPKSNFKFLVRISTNTLFHITIHSVITEKYFTIIIAATSIVSIIEAIQRFEAVDIGK